MKRLLLFVFCFLAIGINTLADDVIVLRNGDFINGIVTEVSTNQIKYKKASNPNGPLYSLETSKILSIKYSNGEVEKFESSTPETNSEQPQSTRIKATPAYDNEEHKSKYADLPILNLETSNKKSKDFFPIMAFTDSSVISTDEITIFISPEGADYYEKGWRVKIGYTILIVNKTDNPIYIDRANCFRRNNDYDTKSYFENQQTIVTHGNSKGGGFGIGMGLIGGFGIGSSSSSSHSENHGVDRFLVIGPHSKANLVDYKYIRLSETKAEFKTVSDIEYWGFNIRGESDINQGEIKTYTEENSPYSNSYYITYSTDPEFKSCYTVNFELYAKYIVGTKLKDSTWSMALGPTKIIKEYKKIIPDFWSDCLNIIGMPGEYY